MTDYRPLNSWNRKTSLLRDRSNSARGQRRRQKTSLAFRHTSVHSDCVRNGCTRERLEYANRPQLCIKGGLGAISSSRCQTTHASQANPGRRESVSLLDERNRLPATGRRLVLSQALTQRLLRQQSLTLEPSRNGCRPQGCRNRRQSCTPNAKPGQSSRVADLVEPDGIEPTTSCLQSRRSPN